MSLTLTANEYTLTLGTAWASSAGAVTGPGVSVDNTLPRWDGVAGDTIQGSGVILDDTNNLSGLGSISGASLSVTGAVAGATVAATGAISGGSLAISGDVLADPGSAGLADGGVIDSNFIKLRGYYDSDPGAGITPTAYEADIQLDVTGTTPAGAIRWRINGVQQALLQSTGTFNASYISVPGNALQHRIANYVIQAGGTKFQRVTGQSYFDMVLGGTFSLQADAADGASAVAFDFNTFNAFITAGAKVVSIKNNGTEKSYIDKDGSMIFSAAGEGIHFSSTTIEALYSLQGTNDAGGGVELWRAGTSQIMKMERRSPSNGLKIRSFGLDTFELVSDTSNAADVNAFTLNTTTSLTDAAAALLSLQNASTEKLYVDKDGGVFAGSTLATTGATNALQLDLRANSAQSTQIASIRKANGDQIFQVNSVGRIFMGSTTGDGVELLGAGGLTMPTLTFRTGGTGVIEANLGVPITIKGDQADGATANAIILQSNENFATAGAKLVSIRNNGVEKTYFDKDGNIILSGSNPNSYISGSAGKLSLDSTNGAILNWNSGQGKILLNGNGIALSTTVGSGRRISGVSGDLNGASALAFIWDTANALTTAGAKLVEWRNLGTAKFSIDKDGLTNFVLNDATGPTTPAVLSNIGSSGPTTALQATWLRISINGTTHWVPAWT